MDQYYTKVVLQNYVLRNRIYEERMNNDNQLGNFFT